MLWLNFCFIVIPQVINGIKFPGPCPEVPPTQYSDNILNIDYCVVYIAPFAEKESNLFQQIPNDYLLIPSHCNTEKVIIKYWKDRLLYGSFSKPKTRAVSAKTTQDQTEEEILYSTNIVDIIYSYDEEAEYIRAICNKSLTESVRVWFTGLWDIIIWSCHEVQVDNKIFHDSALIYGRTIGEDPQNTTMFEEMVGNFKNQAKIVFNNSLDDIVKWPRQMNENCEKVDLFMCPSIRKQGSFGILIAIIIVPILIILGVSKVDVIKKFCRSNKIYPL